MAFSIVKSKFIVSIALLAFYIYFFGYQSIHRYLENGINIVNMEDKQSPLTPPGKIYYRVSHK